MCGVVGIGALLLFNSVCVSLIGGIFFFACELFSKLASMFGVIEFDAFGFGGYDIYLLW